MSTTKRERERLTHQKRVLVNLGFTRDEADRLRRISLTLRRWHELECGTGSNYADYAIERDSDGIPYMVTHLHGQGVSKTYRHRVPDREKGAHKRLGHIIGLRNTRVWAESMAPAVREVAVLPYIQTDPRGSALYILRPGDVPEGLKPDECYTRGICIY